MCSFLFFFSLVRQGGEFHVSLSRQSVCVCVFSRVCRLSVAHEAAAGLHGYKHAFLELRSEMRLCMLAHLTELKLLKMEPREAPPSFVVQLGAAAT